jgi:hypothetical protein
VENRTELQVILEILERGLDLDELDIELPQLCRILGAQIGAKQIASFAAARLS